MADFPAWQKNQQTATKPVTVDAPDFQANDTRSAEERWLDQQWRDVQSRKTGEMHPLSINRDSSYVTADPYTS